MRRGQTVGLRATSRPIARQPEVGAHKQESQKKKNLGINNLIIQPNIWKRG